RPLGVELRLSADDPGQAKPGAPDIDIASDAGVSAGAPAQGLPEFEHCFTRDRRGPGSVARSERVAVQQSLTSLSRLAVRLVDDQYVHTDGLPPCRWLRSIDGSSATAFSAGQAVSAGHLIAVRQRILLLFTNTNPIDC